MTAPFLLAEAAASANPVTQITNEFGITWPTLTAQAVNFILVASLLWYFAFKPVLATIGARQKKIDDGLKYAEEMKAKLEAARQACDAQLHEARLQAREIVAEAQKAARELADRQQQEAAHRANHLVETAQAAIELEKRKMLSEARAEIARLVVATTQQVLARQLTDQERSRYNEAAARELLQA